MVVWNDFKVTNSFTLETSMYGRLAQESAYHRRGTVEQLKPEDFYSIGLNLLKTFKQYIIVEKHLEKELHSNGGWLKKKKVDEMVGMTARQKMQQEALIAKQTPKAVTNYSTKAARHMSLGSVNEIFSKNAKSAKKPPARGQSCYKIGQGRAQKSSYNIDADGEKTVTKRKTMDLELDPEGRGEKAEKRDGAGGLLQIPNSRKGQQRSTSPSNGSK